MSELKDAKTSILVTLLSQMADWFSDHEQAAKDCRDYVDRKDLIPAELLDEVFGRSAFYEKEDLPTDIVINADDLDVSDWLDSDEVETEITMYLEDRFGYLPQDTYDWDVLTDREDEVFAVSVNHIDWL